MDGLPPVMYRLTDATPTKRLKGVLWILTFTPVLPRSSPELSAESLVITVSDARHEVLADHGPNFTREEIEAMEPPAVQRRRRS